MKVNILIKFNISILLIYMLFLLSFCNNYKKSEINSNNFIDTMYYTNSEDNNDFLKKKSIIHQLLQIA